MLSKLKLVLVILTIGFLLSCKNNKDGYSDEIDTTQTPTDTTSADTTKISTGTNSTGATGTESEGVTGAGSISAPGTSTTGTGTGPGPSAKDGSAYDISSQSKKDTTKLGSKAKSKVKVSEEKETKE